MKNLLTRTLTGIFFVAAIVSAIYFHPYGFLALFAVVVGLALWEFYGLDLERMGWRKPAGIAGGMYLFTASFFYAGGFVSHIIFYPYILFLIVLLISSLYLSAPNPIRNCAMIFFPQFYCAGLLSTMNFIVFDPATKQYFPWFALLIFLFVWLNDTGAYLTGITLGKHRLFQRISPLKSWEGFIGGITITSLASLGIAYFFPEFISWYHSLTLAIITGIFATYGDLVESLLKRIVGVKDSGTLMPGHGGVLDRFDSVVMVIPVAFLYIDLFIRN